MQIHRPRLAAIAVPALLLTACAAPQAPATLIALPAPALVAASPAGPVAASAPARAGAAGAGAALTPRWLAVRRVAVPEYLRVRAVRFRAADAVLQAWPNAAWSERIEVAVSRHLVAALGTALPGWTVCEGLCPGAAPQPLLSLDLQQADLLREQRVLRIRAAWVQTAPGGATVLAQGRLAFDQPLAEEGAAGHAQALARALDRAATELAAALR